MAAVFVNKFPGDSFLHNLLHLSMTWQMLDDSFINMPQQGKTFWDTESEIYFRQKEIHKSDAFFCIKMRQEIRAQL